VKSVDVCSSSSENYNRKKIIVYFAVEYFY
jgi:hypothetical protein